MNTEPSVGRSTSIKHTKTYIAKHPYFGNKVYVGATYQDLSVYETSSNEIKEAIAKTGIRPEFIVIEDFTFDAKTASPDDHQFVFRRARDL